MVSGHHLAMACICLSTPLILYCIKRKIRNGKPGVFKAMLSFGQGFEHWGQAFLREVHLKKKKKIFFMR